MSIGGKVVNNFHTEVDIGHATVINLKFFLILSMVFQVFFTEKQKTTKTCYLKNGGNDSALQLCVVDRGMPGHFFLTR